MYSIASNLGGWLKYGRVKDYRYDPSLVVIFDHAASISAVRSIINANCPLGYRWRPLDAAEISRENLLDDYTIMAPTDEHTAYSIAESDHGCCIIYVVNNIKTS